MTSSNPIALESAFTELQSAGGACLRKSISSHRSEIGAVHQLDIDIAVWSENIDGPAIEQLAAARKELAFAEYLALTGMYSQAYASLRLFLELSFASVYFSVHELIRRKWLSGKYDFSWSAALDKDSGLLSKDFVEEFLPVAAEDARQYAATASKCYRMCSEFVHGKDGVARELPLGLVYSAEAFSAWCDVARDASTAVLFLLLIRYFDSLDESKVTTLQPTILENFRHHNQIRDLLDGTS